MEIKRDRYLKKLTDRMNNGLIKVITGIRRSGKSYLLFELFYKHLKEQGVNDDHIIKLALDDRRNKQYRNPDALCDYVYKKIVDEKQYYILLDEVQFVDEFEDVLNSFLHIKNADTYVTGSNAKFLSKDIITEFRGRGDEIKVNPLSFSEFYTAFEGDKRDAWREYFTYGGMPLVLMQHTHEDKSKYLSDLFSKIYLDDIMNRNNIGHDKSVLEDLLNIISSSVGSLTNPSKLSKTFKSIKNISVSDDTIAKYLDYFIDAFMVYKAQRYDVKGRKYIGSPMKYYFSDIGLRNARLNFRQQEENHIMENIIYNELLYREFDVDVGVVEYNYKDSEGKKIRTNLEIDFVANKGSERYYIQSALTISAEEKRQQEINSLRRVKDSFKKIVVVKDDIIPWYDENGIYYVGIEKFLLEENER